MRAASAEPARRERTPTARAQKERALGAGASCNHTLPHACARAGHVPLRVSPEMRPDDGLLLQLRPHSPTPSHAVPTPCTQLAKCLERARLVTVVLEDDVRLLVLELTQAEENNVACTTKPHKFVRQNSPMKQKRKPCPHGQRCRRTRGAIQPPARGEAVASAIGRRTASPALSGQG
eukprot:scaffold15965_cov111-Isochrysis_galbana.AAC.2